MPPSMRGWIACGRRPISQRRRARPWEPIAGPFIADGAAVLPVRSLSHGKLGASACPEAVRAVAAANGQNRVSIIVPCHRVIGRDGRRVGYGGGQARKQWLLDHEARWARPDEDSCSPSQQARKRSSS